MLKTVLLCFIAFASYFGLGASKITFEDGVFVVDTGKKKYKLDKTKVSEKEEKRMLGKKSTQEVKAFLAKIPAKSHKLPMLEPRDQGQRGSCNVFPPLGLIEYFVGNKADYSEQCLLYHSSDKDGGNPYQRLVYAKDNGLHQETDCPYIKPEDYFDDWYFVDDKKKEKYLIEARNIIPDLSKAKKVYPKFQIASRYFDDHTIGENLNYIRKNILANKPVAAAVYVVSEKGWGSGEIKEIPDIIALQKICKKDKNKDKEATAILGECGAHAILIIGFDDDKRVFYFRNSWGQGWGLNESVLSATGSDENKGYGMISYEHFARFGLNNIMTLE